MNSKLPKVYVGTVAPKANVNQQSTSLNSQNNSLSLESVLDDSNKYLFNHRYLITLKNNKVIESSIISKIGTKVLTIDNDAIDINDIKTIIEIKK
ncbi:MAG: hypothetical protein PUD34_04020 [bacterium]|nr:hypothetical protein [bacterium]